MAKTSRQWVHLLLAGSLTCMAGGLGGCYYYHHSYCGGYPSCDDGGYYGGSHQCRSRATEPVAESSEPTYRAPEPPPPPPARTTGKRRRRSPEG